MTTLLFQSLIMKTIMNKPRRAKRATAMKQKTFQRGREGGREGGREAGREGGREGGREAGREGEREIYI